jgi:hypothetical protein
VRTSVNFRMNSASRNTMPRDIASHSITTMRCAFAHGNLSVKTP